MSAVFSAKGMNSAGATSPSSGWRQRSKASAEPHRPEGSSIRGCRCRLSSSSLCSAWANEASNRNARRCAASTSGSYHPCRPGLRRAVSAAATARRIHSMPSRSSHCCVMGAMPIPASSNTGIWWHCAGACRASTIRSHKGCTSAASSSSTPKRVGLILYNDKPLSSWLAMRALACSVRSWAKL